MTEGLEELRVGHDEVEVQAEEDGHPGLDELVVAAGRETARQRADEVEEATILGGEGAQLEVCGGGGEGL